MGGIFRIAPPLTISEADLETGLDILDDSVRTVVGSG
jgi:2,2-dialkylglycine decarboxylase (pyruvate)